MDAPSPPPNCVLSSHKPSSSSYSTLPTNDNSIPSRNNDVFHPGPNRFRCCPDQGRPSMSLRGARNLSLPWFGWRKHPSYASIETYSSDFTAVPESMLFREEVFDATELYDQHYPPPSLSAPSAGAWPVSQQRKHQKCFEPWEWPKVLIHVILCLVAYPILVIFVIIARNKTLFWCRLFVNVGCNAIGFVLGLSLLALARPFQEAATWAIIIHQSRISDAPGIRLSDLAAPSTDPTSAWPALHLLWSRFVYPGTTRKERRHYDKRPWSLAILFFLLNVTLTASLPFIIGRIVNITTFVSHQRTEYQEVTVKGDLSESDISTTAALASAFNDYAITWTLSPFGAHISLPTAISYAWNNDTVYFSEASLSQFVPDGSGFGTLTENATMPTDSASVATDSLGTNAVEPGSYLRYPRWGIRIHCEKVPDGSKNIVPPRTFSNYTYLFTPRETMDTLFSSFGLPNLSSGLENNLKKILHLNDTLPPTLDVNSTAFGASFMDNGVGHTLQSRPVTMGEEGFGWISIEWLLVRLNTSYAPNGAFPLYSAGYVLDENGTETRIGYDAAVCLELYDPYVVETYNSTTGVPSSTGIVSQSKEITSDSPDERRTGDPVTGSYVKRQLNSTGLKGVYDTLHGNSVNQMLKDNGRDASYVPSPTLISFTNGSGPYGYTELSGELFAKARARADATNLLPYFAGSADTLARQYPDRVMAYAEIPALYMISLLIPVLCIGVLAGFFVPTLPCHVPHRGFDIYSWLAAFRANELIVATDSDLRKGMDTKRMAELMGDSRVTYQW